MCVCVTDHKQEMNDLYENRNWQTQNIVLFRRRPRHIILSDLITSFECISYNCIIESLNLRLKQCLMCDRRLFSVLLLFYSFGLSRMILSQFKNIFSPKRMHSVMREDTDEVCEKNKTKQANKQQKQRSHTHTQKRIRVKINGLKLNIFIRGNKKYDTVNQMRFTFGDFSVIASHGIVTFM